MAYCLLTLGINSTGMIKELCHSCLVCDVHFYSVNEDQQIPWVSEDIAAGICQLSICLYHVDPFIFKTSTLNSSSVSFCTAEICQEHWYSILQAWNPMESQNTEGVHMYLDYRNLQDDALSKTGFLAIIHLGIKRVNTCVICFILQKIFSFSARDSD